MKKMKSYILPILFFASFVFNFFTSNAMDNLQRTGGVPVYHIGEMTKETRTALVNFSQEIRGALLTFPRELCRSLLLLGFGVTGLTIIASTLRHTINSEKEPNNHSKTLLTNLLEHTLSLGCNCLKLGFGTLCLATGFWGLNSKVNFKKLFGSKIVPSCLRQESKPEEKQD